MQYNPYAIPLFILLLPMFWITVSAWRFRANLTARLFFFQIFFGILYMIGYALELSSTTLEGIKFSLALQYFGQISLIFWFLFALSYSGFDRLITYRSILLIFVLPTITIGLVLTNDTHGFIWRYIGTKTTQGLVFLDREYGSFFSVWAIFLYAIGLIGSFILIKRITKAQDILRTQAYLIAIGIVISLGANALTILRLTPINGLIDLTPYAIGASSIPIGLAIFRYSMFNLFPIAFNAVFDAMRDSVIICNFDGHILEINAIAKANFKELRDSIGKVVYLVFPYISSEAIRHPQKRQEFCYAERCYQLDSTQTPKIAGNREGVVIVIRDITEEKELLQRELKLSIEREKTTLLAQIIQDITHDIRTPVTVIAMTAHLMERLVDAIEFPEKTTLAPEKILPNLRKQTTTLQTYAHILGKISEQLNESLISQQKDSITFNYGNLNSVVAEQVDFHQIMAQEAGITVICDLDPHLPKCLMSENQVRRVVNKLVENAIQYTPRGGKISISTYSDNLHIFACIEDSGIGISSDHLPFIFEDFYRVQKERPSTGGSGLGLSIAKRIMTYHGGQILVESTPKVGSKFLLSFPLSLKS